MITGTDISPAESSCEFLLLLVTQKSIHCASIFCLYFAN